MILAFVANTVLIVTPGTLFYDILFVGQCLFYGMATLAWLFPPLKKRSKLLKLAYYFAFMNASVVLGFFRFLLRQQSANWEKARRAA